MRRIDAHTAAANVLDRVFEKGRPQAVFIIGGVVRTADPTTKTGLLYMEHNELYWVGTYSDAARVIDIIDDLLHFVANHPDLSYSPKS